jgi:methionine biosynthesis protein MetW
VPERRTRDLEAASTARGYYDSYWETEGWQLTLPAELRELLAEHVGADDRCLDVGCGDGQTTGVWLQEHAGSYVGVDVSESAVRMAAERGLDARLVDDAAELPFADESFELATGIEVLEHLFEPQKALAEVVRVLRPGGRLIITVPNAAHWRNRVDLAMLGRWNPRGDHLSATQPWRDPHIRFFTVDGVTRLIGRCGFEVLDRGGFVEHPLLHHVPGLRLLSRSKTASPIGRKAARLMPRVLSTNAYVVGRKAPYSFGRL